MITTLVLAIVAQSPQIYLTCHSENSDRSERECKISHHGTFEDDQSWVYMRLYGEHIIERVLFQDPSQIKKIPKKLYENFPNLKYLQLNGTSITGIKRGDFAHANNSVTIEIAFSPIVDIEDFAFEGLPKVKRLLCHHNKLKAIRRNTFEGLTNLVEVDLTGNQIELIEDGAFDTPKLSILRLTANQLKSFRDSVFRVTPPLRHFSAGKNNFTKISSLFNSLTGLKTIDIHSNRVDDLNFTMFSKLANLEDLNVAMTGFKNTTEEDIVIAKVALSQLHVLNLSEGQLTEHFLTAVNTVFANLTRLNIIHETTVISVPTEEVKRSLSSVDVTRWHLIGYY